MAASFAKLVLSLRDRLASKVMPDVKRVYIVAQRPADQLPNLVGDRDILLRVRGFTVSQENVASGGVTDTPLRRYVDIVMRSRCALESNPSDLKWLTEEALGHLKFESDVFNAVQVWTDATDDEERASLFIDLEAEPVRIAQGQDVSRDFRATDGKWGVSVLTLEVVYRQQNEECR